MTFAVVKKPWLLALGLTVACAGEPRRTEHDPIASDARGGTPVAPPSFASPAGSGGASIDASASAQPADASIDAASDPAPRGPRRPTSDTLIELPDVVYLKTDTQSFNRLYYFAVLDGDLWFKPNVEVTGNDQPWSLVPVLPAMQGNLAMVSVDDHGLVVFDHARKLHWTMSEALGTPLLPRWQTAWGAPLSSGPGLTLPEPILKWEFACLTRQEDDYFVDPAGNKQPVGLGTVAHIFILNADGQRITYIDPILPVDTSYEMCGPHRGRFRSANLSTSGSTAFVIDEYGDMYTRLYDFDISGADTLFFTYTYEAMPGVPGAPIKLPAPDWVKQPKIQGRITDRITIFKTGKGSDRRTLRVEGLDASGASGFYEKPITGAATSDWAFHATSEPVRGNELDNAPQDRTADALGPGEDRKYVGAQPSAAISLLDFNLYCSPATLQIAFDSGETLALVLHHADAIRQEPRMGRLTAQPRELNGTIEVPEAVWSMRASLGAEAKSFLGKLSATSRFTKVPLSAALETVSLNGWTLTYGGP